MWRKCIQYFISNYLWKAAFTAFFFTCHSQNAKQTFIEWRVKYCCQKPTDRKNSQPWGVRSHRRALTEIRQYVNICQGCVTAMPRGDRDEERTVWYVRSQKMVWWKIGGDWGEVTGSENQVCFNRGGVKVSIAMRQNVHLSVQVKYTKAVWVLWQNDYIQKYAF